MTRGVKTIAADLEVIELAGGGKLRRDPRNLRLGWVTCPDCELERHTRVPSYGDRKLQIYQGKCRTCQNRSRKKTETQRHQSGATLIYDERQTQDPEKIRFLCPTCCPSCDRKHYVNRGSINNSTWKWSGRCNDCRLKERFQVIELPSGGTIRRDPKKSTHGWVTCPGCEEERYINVPTREEIELGRFTGLCPKHAGVRRKKLTGTKQHQSGATILYDESDPARSGDERAAFLCVNPDNNPECLVKSYAWFNQFDDSTWRGLCSSCYSKQPPPRRIVEDVFLKDGPNGKGTVIHYSHAVGKEVEVTYWRCGHTITLTRGVVHSKLSGHRSGRRPWPSICYPCALNPVSLFQGAINISDERKNEVAEKRGRGRIPKPPEVKRAELARRQGEFEDKIRELGKRIPRHQITRAIIADEYADNRGDIPEESTVGKWVREFYGKGVSVPAAVNQILDGCRINTAFDRENKSPI